MGNKSGASSQISSVKVKHCKERFASPENSLVFEVSLEFAYALSTSRNFSYLKVEVKLFMFKFKFEILKINSFLSTMKTCKTSEETR